MKKLIDVNDPFFAQIWRRWAITVLPLLWAGVELWNKAPMWAFIFAAAGLYAGCELLLKPWLNK